MLIFWNQGLQTPGKIPARSKHTVFAGAALQPDICTQAYDLPFI
jgi:hypothetical protein